MDYHRALEMRKRDLFMQLRQLPVPWTLMRGHTRLTALQQSMLRLSHVHPKCC